MTIQQKIISIFKSAYSGTDYSLGTFQEANPDARQRFFFGSNKQKCPSINLGETDGHYVFKNSWYGNEEKQRQSATDFAKLYGGRADNSGTTWFAVIPNTKIREAVDQYLKIANPSVGCVVLMMLFAIPSFMTPWLAGYIS